MRKYKNGLAINGVAGPLFTAWQCTPSDTYISSSDIVLGNEYTWSLPGQQYRDITVPVPIPNYLPIGSYYVGWIIDPDNDIQEFNEQDNTAYRQGERLQVQ